MRNVVAGHNHFNTLRGASIDTGNVGGPEIELGTIAGEERGMTAAFFLRQNVNLGSERECAGWIEPGLART